MVKGLQAFDGFGAGELAAIERGNAGRVFPKCRWCWGIDLGIPIGGFSFTGPTLHAESRALSFCAQAGVDRNVVKW